MAAVNHLWPVQHFSCSSNASSRSYVAAVNHLWPVYHFSCSSNASSHSYVAVVNHPWPVQHFSCSSNVSSRSYVAAVNNSNLPSLPVCRVVYPFFTTSTRLPVFLNFYPFWEFRFQKKKSKKKKVFFVCFYP